MDDRCGDQKRDKVMYGRVDQHPEGAPEKGTTLDQAVGNEQEREKNHHADCQRRYSLVS